MGVLYIVLNKGKKRNKLVLFNGIASEYKAIIVCCMECCPPKKNSQAMNEINYRNRTTMAFGSLPPLLLNSIQPPSISTSSDDDGRDL